MRLKLKRKTKFLVFISLFCLSFLLVPNHLSQNSPNPNTNQDSLPDSIPLNLSSITFPWGNDNGTVINSEANAQLKQQIISDGLGGAITVWRDFRIGNYDLYAQRVDSDGNILWDANGTAIVTDPANQDDFGICTDGNGGVIIAFEDWRDSNWNIYVQYINATGDVQWTTDGVRIVSQTASQINPKAARDGQGGAYVVWEDYRNSNYDIFAQRINATGDTLWTTNGVGVITDGLAQNGLEIIPDGFNNSIFVWEDERGSGSEVYAQKLDLAGNDLWTTDGVAVTDQPGTQFNAKLSPDGAGGAIITWNDFRGGSFDIYAQRINSSGSNHWTLDGLGICTAANNQLSPAIVSDDNGGAIMTWVDERNNTGNEDVYAQRINSAGQDQWTAQGVAVSNLSGDQNEAVIAHVDNGSTIIAWTDDRTGTDDIYAQYLTSTGMPLWAANGSAVTTAQNAQYNPEITSSNVKSAIIVWRDARDDVGDIYLQRVFDADNEGPSTPIVSSPTHPVEGTTYYWPDITLEWPESTDATGVYNYIYMYDQISDTVPSPGNSTTFINMTTFTGVPDGTWYFHVRANDTLGNLGDADHFQFVIDAWPADGVPVHTDFSEEQDHPQITTDGAGGAIMSWHANTGDSYIWAQRIAASGQYMWDPNGTIICDTWPSRSKGPTALCSDGAGGAIVVWADYRNLNYDIYAQRINSTGQVQWTTNGIVICNAGSGQEWPEIASDGAGGAYIVWEDDRGPNYDIYAQHINSSGDPQWTSNGIVICNASGQQNRAELILSGTSGTIITWEDLRDGSEDVYAQRIEAGIPMWGLNGVPICTAANNQRLPLIVPDGEDGGIIMWEDERADGGDIYAQRVNVSGATQWNPNGTAICVESGDQSQPRIASDENGGSIIVWGDNRDNWDIYAQKINSTGQVQWTANGIVICNYGESQTGPGIASDGFGGAIIAWSDWRSMFDSDIFAQHVNATGYSLLTANGTQICGASESQYFPQCHSTMQSAPYQAMMVWSDMRNSMQIDIYTQRVTGVDQHGPGAPVVSSPTHPDENFAYSSPNGTIEWTAYDPSGISHYYYTLDQNESSVPTTADSNTTAQNVNFISLTSGTWYFRVRAMDQASNIGEIADFTIQVDDSCNINLLAQTLESSTNQTHNAVLADFDLDGDLDIATSDNSSTAAPIYILWNPFDQGAGIDPFDDLGNWSKTTVGHAFGYVRDLEVGDLNNDGTPDLISSEDGTPVGVVKIWNNNGTPGLPNWEMAAVYSQAFQIFTKVEVGDVNNDGDLDIVFAEDPSDVLYLIANPYSQGYNPFNSSWNWNSIGGSAECYDLEMVDLDRNGLLDVLYSAESGRICVIRNNDGGSWTDLGYIIENSEVVRSLEIADLDHNGTWDLVGITHNQEILAFRHNGSPFSSGWSKTVVGQGNGTLLNPRALRIGDLDNNGYDDIITAFITGQESYIQVYQNNKRPFHDNWATRIEIIVEPRCFEISLGDLDHDGDLDAAFGCENFYLAENLLQRFNPSLNPSLFNKSNPIAPLDGVKRFEVVDLDHDGDLDLLTLSGNYSSTLYGWRNNGDPFGMWTPLELANVSATWGLGLEIGDFDNDGWMDCAMTGDDGLFVLRNNHSPWAGAWEQYQTNSIAGGLTEIRAADFDNDGFLDLTTISTDTVYVLRNNGTPFRVNWSAYTVGVGGDDFIDIQVADFDKDSWMDIAANHKDVTIVVWRNNHSPFIDNWDTSVDTFFLSEDWRMTPCDLDHDGDTDLALAHIYRTTGDTLVTVAECDDTPFIDPWFYVNAYNQFSYYGGGGVACGDLDNDGWPDIFEMSRTATAEPSYPVPIVLTNDHSPFTPGWDSVALNYGSWVNTYSEDVHIIDIDFDGDRDILVGTTAGSGGIEGIVIWENLLESDVSGPSAPVITSLDHPNNATWYNSPTSNMTWTTPSDLSGVYNYYYTYDANPNTVPNITHSSTALNWAQISAFTEGTWYFHVRANDTLGNLGDTAHFFFRADLIPPVASNPSPAPESYTANVTTSIQIVVFDALSEVNLSTLTVNVEGVEYNTSSPQLSTLGQNPSTVTFTPPAPYTHAQVVDVIVQITDQAQNWMAPYYWNFTIDVAGPNALNPSPESGSYTSNATPDIIVYLDDALAGVNASSVSMRINSSMVNPNVTAVLLPSLGPLDVISPAATPSHSPEIAIDSLGNIHVVWHDDTSPRNVRYRCWNATTLSWTLMENITLDSTDDATHAAIAVDPSGNVHVAWEDDSDGWWGTDTTIFYRFRNATTGIWSGNINSTDVIAPGRYAYSCDIAVDHAGQAHIVWYESAFSALYYSSWNATAGSWITIEEFTTESTAVSLGAAIAIDSIGQPHVVWYDNTNLGEVDSNAYDIFYKYRNITTGNWTSVEVISLGSPQSARYPDIAIDPADHVHVVWRDQRIQAGGNIYYRQRNAPTENWTSLEVVSTFSSTANYPRIAVNGGFVYIVWQDNADYDGAGGSDYDIFSRVLDISNAIWSDIEVVSTESNETTTQCWYTALALDGAGTAHILWEDTLDYMGSGGDWKVFYKNLTINSLWEVASSPPPYAVSMTAQVDVDAADLLGNTMITYTWLFTVDLDAPVASNPNPLNESIISNADPVIYLDLADPLSGINASSISLTVNGSLEVHTWNGTTLWWDSSGPYAHGTLLNLAVDAQDNVGNAMSTYSWWFSIDTEGPTIVLDAPVNNTALPKPSRINLTISDSAGLDTRRWRANVTQTTWTSLFIGSSDIDLSSFGTDQTVHFWVEANDSVGNLNQIEIILTFDDTPPTASNPYPLNGSYITNDDPTILLNLLDALSGINVGTINLLVNGVPESISSWNGTTLSWDSNGAYTNGAVLNVTVNVQDNAGNTMAPYIWTFTIDVTPPLVFNPSPENDTYITTSTPNITISVADPLSGIDTINMHVNGSLVTPTWTQWDFNWSLTEVVSTESTAGSQYPRIATDHFGNLHVVWRDQTNYMGAGGEYDIFYKCWNATTMQWMTTVVVSTESDGTSYSPTIAVDNWGHVYVAWYDNMDYSGSGSDPDIFYKRWNATTGIWTITEVVSTESDATSSYPDIVVDIAGHVHITWDDITDYNGCGSDRDVFYKRWNASSNSWTLTEVISNGTNEWSETPRITADLFGNVHIIWDQTIGANSYILHKYWNATTGIWTPNETVSTESPSVTSFPAIVTDSNGHLHVVWLDSSTYAGSGTDIDVFYKRWNASTSTWTMTELVSNESSVACYSPTLAVDNTGKVHVAWYEYLNARRYIYYNHRNATNSAWTAAELIAPETTSEYTYRPDLAVDDQGLLHIVWEDDYNWQNSGSDHDIFYKKKVPSSYFTLNWTAIPPYLSGSEIWVEVNVTDNVGNVLSQYQWNFTVDLDAPIASNPYPINSSFIASSTPNIGLGIIDLLSGIDDGTLVMRVNGSTVSHSWNGIRINWTPSISYTSGAIIPVEVDVQDNAGNMMTTYSWSFTVDLDPPQASNPAPANGDYTGDEYATLSVNLGDSLSDINATTIVLTVEGIVRIHGWNGTTVSWSPASPYVNAQVVDVQLDAIDNVGNIMTTYTWAFTVDLTSPNAINPWPENASYVSDDTPNIEIELFDYLSGVNISSVQMLVNGSIVSFDWQEVWVSTEVVSEGLDGTSFHPAIAVDSLGNVHVVWYDHTFPHASGGDWDIFYRCWNATVGNWTAIEVVSTESTADSYLPVIAIDTDGNPHVAWNDNTDFGWNGGENDVFYKLKNMTTGLWTGRINTTDVVSSDSAGSSEYPAIALDSLGNVYLAWRDTSDWDGEGDFDIFFKYWNNTIGIWTGFVNVTDVISTESDMFSNEPSIAVDPAGNVHISWQDDAVYGNSGADRDVFYKYWNSTLKVWSGYINATDVISTESNLASRNSEIIADQSGVVHITWNDNTDGWWGTNEAIFYKHWNVSIGIWTGYVNTTDVLSFDCPGNSQFADIQMDLAGNIYVSWMDDTDWDGESDRDVVYKYWDVVGKQWTGIQVVSTESTLNSDNPRMAIDNHGQLHFIWDDLTELSGEGSDTDVFYKKGLSAHHIIVNWTPSVAYPNGAVIPVIIDAQDNVGNSMATYSWSFIIDTEGPQASSPSPSAAYVADNQPTITITLEDLLSGVNASSINLNVEGIDYNITDLELSYGGTTVTFNPSSAFADGQQIDIALDARDSVGNAMFTLTWFFTIDISGPSAGNETPSTGTFVNTPFPSISVDLADVMSGVNASTIVLTVASIVRPHVWDGTTVSWSSGSPFADGQVVFCQVEASDNLGNIMGPYAWFYTVDISSPVALTPQPANGGYTNSNQPMVNISLIDMISGVNASTIILNVGGTDYNVSDSELSYNSSILTFTPSILFSDNDIINFTLNAADNVNNPMAPFLWSFTVDLTAPIATSELPANNTQEYITETPQINVTLSDMTSGINASSIILRVNGNPVAHSFDGVNVTFTPAPLPQLVWNNVTVDASDMVGNPMPQYRWSFLINLSRPTIRDVSPFNNSYLSDVTPIIGAFIDSPHLDIVVGTINLTVNGVQVEANYDNATGEVWNLTVIPFSHGQLVQITLSANDTIDNTCFASWSFTIDLNDPVVTGHAPVAAYVNNSLPTILINITDALSGVNGTSIAMNISGVPVSPAWDGLTVSWNPGVPFLNGDVIVVVLDANDNAGNPLPTYGFFFTIDIVAPVVNILAPVALDIYQGGTNLNITWTVVDVSPCTVTIEYSDNNGSTWQEINAGVYSPLDDGIELWAIPMTDSVDFLLRINATDTIGFTISNETDDPFIIWITYPSITISNPTSITVINATELFTIEWIGTGGAGNRYVTIEYSTNNGTNWQQIGSSFLDNGSLDWITPSEDSNECLIRINVTDGAVHTNTTTSDRFIIDLQDPSCSFGLPIVGLTLNSGDVFIISWIANDTASSITIRIEYTLDGTHWYDINAGGYSNANDGAESWAIPSVATDSDQCRLRLTATDGAGHTTEILSGFFTVKAKPSEDNTLMYVIIAIAAAAAAVVAVLVVRSRRKPTVALSPERDKWINALGERIRPEMSMQQKLQLILAEDIPLAAVKDPELTTLLNSPLSGSSREVIETLQKLPIPESELQEILGELPNLTPEELKTFLDELTKMEN